MNDGYPKNPNPTDGKEEPPEDARISRVIEALGVENTHENREQMRVYLQAFGIFIERNARHRAQWRVGGLQGLLVDIRKKVERLWNEFMLSPTPPKDMDSAIDAINYLAFFVQAKREESFGGRVGTWIWPEISRPESSNMTKVSPGSIRFATDEERMAGS